MTDLKINVLGGLEIAGSGAKPLTRKAKAVAAYLALQRGQPQSREKIAAMFWENSPEEQARTNLRQCLSTLRKHFDSALITEFDAISLDPSAVEVDAYRFEELIGGEDHKSIEAAVALYKGDLLEGFGLKEEAFEAWIRMERERCRTLFVDGLLRLVDHREASKDAGAVVKLAARLLALDPLNERAHRSLMSAYASQGRHDAALKQFEICRNVLDRELGVPPQPETVELRNRLRSDRKSRGESQNTVTPPANFASELDALGIDFSTPSRPSIILTPIKDLSPNGELSHFAEGIRIDVQCALVKISSLFVIAAGSAAIYADRPSRPEQVSQEMGVRFVFEGSIQGNAEHIRVTAQLTDGLSGQVVWSERYDRKLDNSLEVQDEIVERIVTSLDVKLVSGEQAKVWRKTIRDPKALELYYKGLEILNEFDKQNVATARRLFEKVTEISPSVTLGPTLVAFCHYWDVTMGWGADHGESLSQAAEWSRRAAAMEDAAGQAHAILAPVRLLQGKHREALEISAEAISIRPHGANANALAANILLCCGRPKDSIERVKSAIRFAPVYASWWVEILATAHRDAGQNELAIAAANELLRKNPESTNAFLILAGALVAENHLEAAKSHGAKVLTLDPEFSLSRYAAQHPYQDQEPFRRHLANLRKAGLPK